MKIEKINDNQIKFILNKTDLIRRDIKINELAYGSEKTQDLFNEIMEQASIEYDFHADNIPLMIEAVPVDSEELMIIITKILNNSSFKDKFNILVDSKEKLELNNKKNIKRKQKFSGTIIYSFENLEYLISSCKKININNISSSVYKYNNIYFLTLDNIKDPHKLEKLNILLSEYGVKHIANYISKQYILEHGQCIIKKDAINLLKKL